MTALEALLVVRDPLLRHQLRSVLARAGMTVSEAATADAALAAATRRVPDFLVVEQALDGGALVGALRAKPGANAIPVLALTEPGASARELAAEVNDLIPKPIDLERFEKRVQLALRGVSASHSLARARDELALQLRAIEQAHAHAGLGLWECDPASDELALSPAALRVFGVESAPRSLEELLLAAVHPDDRAKLREALSTRQVGAASGALEHRTAHGLRFLRHLPLRSGAQAPSELPLAFLAQDVTTERVAEDRMRRIALYDPVTELPGRSMFEARIERALHRNADSESCIALLWIELAGMRDVEGTHGLAVHDEALRSVAARLLDCLRTRDAVGRISSTQRGVARIEGDRFAAVLTDIRRLEDALTCAKRVATSLAHPLEVAANAPPLLLSPHIGIALSPRDGSSVGALLASAEQAAIAAAQAHASYRFSDAPAQGRSGRAATILADLEGVAERGELSMLLQPRISLARRSVAGAEALVRWRHPQLGEIAPKDFIGIAERDGLIESIGKWVLASAASAAARWPGGRISVNVSRSQLLSSDFAPSVFRALIDANLRPEQLELEVTESLMYESESCLEPLRELAAVGVSLALDDFGSGYSSLSALVRFPVNIIKIDRSIVKDIVENPDALRVIRGVVRVAHDLGMRVVAEGVDREGQVPLLVEVECDEVQGFLFARPLPEDQFTQFVSDWDPESTDFGQGNAPEEDAPA